MKNHFHSLENVLVNLGFVHAEILSIALVDIARIANDIAKCERILNVSRKPQYKDVCRGTIEMPQRVRTFNVNCCLQVHNAHRNYYHQFRDTGNGANHRRTTSRVVFFQF